MANNLLQIQTQQFNLAGAGSSIGDTTIVLSSLQTIDGVNITMTNIGTKGFFTIEPGNGVQEEAGTFTGITQNANGTATLTGVSHQLFQDPYTETSGLTKSHAGGTIFVLSNTAGFYNNFLRIGDDETVTGLITFTAPNYPLIDDPLTPPTADGQFTPKKYVDDLISSGAPKATDSVYGISKLSVAAASPTAPIVVGTNDGRVPSQGENDALVGTSGTPSSTNKYVTNDDTSATAAANKVVRAGAGSVINVGFIDTGTTANQILKLDSNAKIPAVDANLVIAGNNQTIFQVNSSSNTRTTNAAAVQYGPSTPTNYTKMKEILYNDIGGVVKVSFQASNISGSGSATQYSRIYVNGIAVGTERSTQATFTEDITVAQGDLIQIYGKVVYVSGNLGFNVGSMLLQYDYGIKSTYITNTSNS